MPKEVYTKEHFITLFYLINYACVLQELFVTDLAKRAFKNSKNNLLEYKHIAEIVQQDDTLDFLREIMPRKITVRQFKQLMAKKAARGTQSSDESSEEEESCEEDSSEESSSSNQDQEQDSRKS